MPTDLPALPVLFIGPVEILLLGLVLIVILFGSRAPDVAERAGESFGKFQQSKQQVEEEVEEVSAELDEVREEVNEVREDVGLEDDLKEIQEDVEEATAVDMEMGSKEESDREREPDRVPDN